MDDFIGFHVGDVPSSEIGEADPLGRELRNLLYDMLEIDGFLSHEVKAALDAEIKQFCAEPYVKSDWPDVEDRIRSVLHAALQRGMDPMEIEDVLEAERSYFLEQMNSPFFDE